MKRTVLPLAAAAACALILATGCTSGATQEKEITSTSAATPLATVTGWEDHASTFAGLDDAAQQTADAVTAQNVRSTVDDNVAVLVDNLSTLSAAADAGTIDADAETAAKNVYKAAGVLDALGADDAQDVGLYIEDISVDAHYLLENLYDGQPGEVEDRAMEVRADSDRIAAFTDDEWDAYAQRITSE